MAAKYCEPCTARGMNPTAFKWCTECEEALCSECTEAHKVQKMSRSHHLVDISKIPNTINLAYNCLEHQHLPFDYFCVDHDVICCKECLPKNHRACKNVTSIDIASQSSKQSQSFLDFEEQLCFILEALGKLKINRKENCRRIEQEQTQIRKQLAITKEIAIKRLESLEKLLLKELNEIKEKNVAGIKQQEKEIGILITSTKPQKEALEFIRDHGSEKQAFLSIHSSKPILDEIENKIKQLTESILDTSLMFVERVAKDNLMEIGSIELKETPCSVSIVPYKQRQSQVRVAVQRKINPFTHMYNIDMKEEKLRGVTAITISDNSTLIFGDYKTEKVYFCNENGTNVSSFNSPYQPWDIAAIPGTTTAVLTCAYYSRILFIDIERCRISKQIEFKVNGRSGVAATKDKIFVGDKGHIHILDLSGNFVRTIGLTKPEHYVNYISICSNGNLCYSSNHQVFCITSDGDYVFCYESPDLRESRNIQIDDADNIYVVGCKSKNIHILTSSGTLLHILWNDNLNTPLALCYSKKLAKAFISNNKGQTISVFEINWNILNIL